MSQQRPSNDRCLCHGNRPFCFNTHQALRSAISRNKNGAKRKRTSRARQMRRRQAQITDQNSAELELPCASFAAASTTHPVSPLGRRKCWISRCLAARGSAAQFALMFAALITV